MNELHFVGDYECGRADGRQDAEEGALKPSLYFGDGEYCHGYKEGYNRWMLNNMTPHIEVTGVSVAQSADIPEGGDHAPRRHGYLFSVRATSLRSPEDEFAAMKRSWEAFVRSYRPLPRWWLALSAIIALAIWMLSKS